MISPRHRPAEITIERAAEELRIRWADGHASAWSLPWIRAHCPCASCREERRARAESDGLLLNSGPPPSAEVTGAELVGNYALRLDWTDGHNSGIYPFSALRQSCPCPECNPAGAPPLLPD